MTRLLTPGTRVEHDGLTYLIERHDLGTVVLPSGEVVGCDPLVAHDDPFTETVAPGSYPLRAWIAVLHRDGREWQRRVAALHLVIQDTPAATWTMALCEGQDPAALDGEEFYGYGVDAGVGTLADVVAIRALEDWDHERVDDVFIPARVPDDPVAATIGAVTDEATGANVFAVPSGWGDGGYPTFVGRAADGNITGFVTDFCVLPD
jgi:hypothetical protein